MDSKRPLISIIMPAYNTCDFILRSLESIKRQTYASYEIIIVNDGSTDNTKAVIEKFAANHPNVIVLHQKNKGASSARNRGISLAKGEFVCFLDSDDTFHPQFLEKMLARQRETSADLVYCGFNRVGFPKNIFDRMDFIEGKILRPYMDGRNFFYFQTMLIKKEVLIRNKIEFEEGRMSTEDLLFTIQILNHVDAYAVKEKLFNYHYRANSATNMRWKKKHWLSEIGGLKKIYDYLKSDYHEVDRKMLLWQAKYNIFIQEINYLSDCLISWKYMDIKYYLTNNDFNEYDEFLNNSDIQRILKKKYDLFKRNNLFNLLIGTLYYKYFRINFKTLVYKIFKKSLN